MEQLTEYRTSGDHATLGSYILIHPQMPGHSGCDSRYRPWRAWDACPLVFPIHLCSNSVLSEHIQKALSVEPSASDLRMKVLP